MTTLIIVSALAASWLGYIWIGALMLAYEYDRDEDCE
jgi:hypothetical protein